MLSLLVENGKDTLGIDIEAEDSGVEQSNLYTCCQTCVSIV